MIQMETRLAEVRLEESEGKMLLEGYAIVFDEEALIGDEERGLLYLFLWLLILRQV